MQVPSSGGTERGKSLSNYSQRIYVLQEQRHGELAISHEHINLDDIEAVVQSVNLIEKYDDEEDK